MSEPDDTLDPDLAFWHQLREDVRGAFPGRIFFTLVIDMTTKSRQWYASAAGPWAKELRECADEYERGFPDDQPSDERRTPHESAFDEN